MIWSAASPVIARRVPLTLALRSLSFAAFACCLAVFWGNPASAFIDYNAAGATYTQNFDSLPSSPLNASLGTTPAGWVDDTLTPGSGQFSILGWYLYHVTAETEGGANGHQRVRAGTGSSNTGSFYS